METRTVGTPKRFRRQRGRTAESVHTRTEDFVRQCRDLKQNVLWCILFLYEDTKLPFIYESVPHGTARSFRFARIVELSWFPTSLSSSKLEAAFMRLFGERTCVGNSNISKRCLLLQLRLHETFRIYRCVCFNLLWKLVLNVGQKLICKAESGVRKGFFVIHCTLSWFRSKQKSGNNCIWNKSLT